MPVRNEKVDLLWQFYDLIVHVDRHLLDLIQHYGTWVYGILFLVIFCETGLVVCPFLPGDSLLFVIGAFAAAGRLDPWLIAGLLITAAFLGDNCNYFIGRFFGHKLFAKPDSRVFRRDRLDATHAFFEKHGGKTLVMARFVPIIRTFAPFVAGMGEMAYARFLAFSLAGGIFWVGSLVAAGYFVGNNEWVQKHLTLVIFGIIGVSLLPMTLQALRAWRARRYATQEGKTA